MEDKLKQSFVLLKPEAIENINVKEYIYNRIESKNLSIVKEVAIELTESQIEYLWPYSMTDHVCKTILTRYLENKRLLLIIVRSNSDAIKKTSELKYETRDKFSNSPFKNYLHTPGDIDEFKKDMDVFFHFNDKVIEFKNPTIIGDFPILDNISVEQNYKCALFLEKILNTYNFEEIAQIFMELSSNIKLFLIDDDIHDAKYTAGVILEYFPEYPVEEAYYIAFGVNYLGEFPLTVTNDFLKAKKIIRFFRNYNLGVRMDHGRSS